MHQQTIVP